MKYFLDRKNERIYLKDEESNKIRCFNAGKMGKAVVGESEKYFAYLFADIFNYGNEAYEDDPIHGQEWREIPNEIHLPIVSSRLDKETYVAYIRLMYQYHNTSNLIRDAINLLMDKALEDVE